MIALGDLVLDVVAAPDAPLVPGSDTRATIRFRAGGSAANTARAIARLGARASFVGAVGGDAIGRRLLASLRADGVRCNVATVTAPTARLVALLDDGGERSFLTQRGAADLLAPAHLRAAWFRGISGLHVPAYALTSEPLRSAARRAASLARERDAAVSVDLASRGPLVRLGRREARIRLAELVPDVVFGTEQEAAVLAADDEELGELAPLVVIKAGSAGCRIVVREGGGTRRLEVATRALPTSDSTGAGDAFDAGFLVAWLPGRGSAGPDLRRAALAAHETARAFLRAPRRELVL